MTTSAVLSYGCTAKVDLGSLDLDGSISVSAHSNGGDDSGAAQDAEIDVVLKADADAGSPSDADAGSADVSEEDVVTSTCMVAADCPTPANPCIVATCVAGHCTSALQPDGAVLPPAQQTAGDCKKLVCDGAGNLAMQTDVTDVPGDDGNPCTSDTCDGPNPHPPMPAGTPCGNGNVCGGPGTCGCPGAAGPAMVNVGQFCIDVTEVTNAQYAAFLASNPSITGQASVCAGNKSFVPTDMWPPAMGSGTLPVVAVDWCDAFAYCKFAGKRLCGKIGGGTNSFDAFSDPKTSQWMNACSSNGANAFPYGATYAPQACAGTDNTVAGCKSGACKPVPVGSLMTCQASGGFAGVFDLSGNVEEWEDACTTAGVCRLRGGAINSGSTNLRCDGMDFGSRTDTSLGVGFRCCGP